MFGLWFSILGLLFGGLCSYEAKRKGRSHQDWFFLGFLFSVAAFVVLHLLPNERSKGNEIETGSDINGKLTLSRPTF